MFLTGLVVSGALAAAPSAASAQGEPLCPIAALPPGSWGPSTPPPEYAYQSVLMPHMEAGAAAAREALGTQFGGLWLDTPRQGWSIAFSPGPLNAETARAAIIARIPSASATVLGPRLTVLLTPYSEAQLKTVQDELMPAMSSGIVAGMGLSCAFSDAWRISVDILGEETPELAARVQELFGRYGDMLHITYGHSRPSIGVSGGLDSGVARLRVRAHVVLPPASRCVRGRTIGARAGKQVRSVTLATGTRRATGKRPRLKLSARTTRITVTVRLRDGRAAVQTFSYRRC